MSDLNGHVGSDKVENIVGDFGLGTRNAEGDALIDFCMRNNLSIMNTFFKHQRVISLPGTGTTISLAPMTRRLKLILL